jgi:fumarylacetoacetase
MSTRSWRYIPARSHFSLANLPFGILSFAQEDGKVDPRPAVAIGEYALDLRTFMEFNGFSGLPSFKPFEGVFKEKTLNAFAGLGRKLHREVRQYLRSVFSETTEFPQILKDNEKLQSLALRHLEDSRVSYHLPFNIGDYTDFYAGRNHAYNVGRMFRGPENALQPNYTHLPVGYHGRASSVIVSKGQNPRPLRVRRPCGQILDSSATNSNVPVFGPCKRLDFELELGAFLCKENIIGERIPITEAEEYIFGFVLLNDWSARDIQAWEYVPLGPFTAKNFATTISPWVVLADALEPFMCEGLESTTELLPYLQEQKRNNVYNINLEVDITSKSQVYGHLHS